jgi:integrase
VSKNKQCSEPEKAAQEIEGMREQRGYVFHKGKSWFLRYCDAVMQPDGTIRRKQVCKKLKVECGGDYRTQKSVQPFVAEILTPLNGGLLNPQSTMLVTEFVERIYLSGYVDKNLRAATKKQYRDIWENHLKPRMGKLTLRGFRTVHGEQMLAQIAAQAKLGQSSLRHCKAFLSGCFKQAKRLGILDGLNPIQDTSIPNVPEASEDTYAYSLAEIKSMLAVLPEPARTIVLTATFSGLRKSELRGLTWGSYNGEQLSVDRSVWNSTVNEPKTKRSRSPIPVVRPLAEALEAHRLRAGILAQPALPIFQAGNGQPLNLDNIARRVIIPALSPCAVCKMQEDGHLPDGHSFERDSSLPLWHGWHAFSRGLATNLHTLGIDDKTIQAILRHSTIGLTQNIYIKSVNESQVSALDSLSEKFEICNANATTQTRVIQ